MQIIPTRPLPSQTMTLLLGDNQPCQIDIAQKQAGLFLTLYLGGEIVCAGVICENRNRIVRAAYTGFVGELMFIDTQGETDPAYTGLGDRFLLAYLTDEDLAAAGVS